MTTYVAVLCLLISTAVTTLASSEFVRVCYYTSWSRYRGNVVAKFDIQDIHPSMCTHLVWAFADIDGGRIKAAEAGVELGGNGRFRQFNSLKTTNPSLKTLISVGGEHAKSWMFQAVAATDASRRTFATSVVDFLVNNGFDGIDIDWEYPNAETKEMYILLLKTLRETLDARQPGLLLYVAVAAGIWTIDPGYNVPEMAKYVDLVNIMTYDYHVVGSKVAAFNSPLYSRPNFHESLSVDYTVRYWHTLGLPWSQMTLGVTGMGRHFILEDAARSLPGDDVRNTSVPGPIYQINGGLAYPEICEFIASTGATPTFDTIQKCPYVVNGTSWVGYENPDSARLKIAMVKQLGMAGLMVWSLDQDDFTGQACNQGKYPLMSAMLDEAGIPLTWPTTSAPATGVTTTTTTTKRPAVVITNSPTNEQNQNSQNNGLSDNGSASEIYNCLSLVIIGSFVFLIRAVVL